ncbi:MAG: aspartate--ammonia ligase [Spirochaetia bacterium]|nr:aspartate--ammonia ligase [Spirochaetia bacterium]
MVERRGALESIKETERAIKTIKDFFQDQLASELRLSRVTAPLFLPAGTGLNDDLNGVERPVSFAVPALGGAQIEVVQSLAKWKRHALAMYGFEPGYGLYTDMNAIRPDETLDEVHSLYVDQWDWEKVILPEQRTLAYLKTTVRGIYGSFRRLEFHLHERYPDLPLELPDDIRFVHAEEARALYPALSPKQREDELAREHGAVFVIGIGGELSDGVPHDGRAPDYDDWSTPNEDGYSGLNGDILVWNSTLGRALELSSMGIRVDPAALERQLDLRGAGDRRNLDFHRRLLAGQLPLTMGGGIGQSRLCLHFLRKSHIGEIQVGQWPEGMRKSCMERGIRLL